MNNEYYTVNDIQLITGLNEIQAYHIIKILNDEIKDRYESYSVKPLIFVDKIDKQYFLKRMEIRLW